MTDDIKHQSPVSVPEGDAREIATRLIKLAASFARREFLPSFDNCRTIRDARAAAEAFDDMHGRIAMDIRREVDRITAALLSAESRGERRMRERAVQVAADYTLRMEIAAQKPHPFTGRENGIAVCKADAGQSITASIRALSLSSPEEG